MNVTFPTIEEFREWPHQLEEWEHRLTVQQLFALKWAWYAVQSGQSLERTYLALTEHFTVMTKSCETGLLKVCKGAYHALRSYQHGNAATALAEETADAIEEVLAQVKGTTT